MKAHIPRNVFLDTCAFDPKFSPEHEAAQRIRKLGNDDEISLVLAHSVQKEIEHPNTPADVKREAQCQIFTIQTGLNPVELATRSRLLALMAGNGNAAKYAADAEHIFEAGKYGGYFLTTDDRILKKREELQRVSQAVILRPSEWLQAFEQNNS